MLKTATVCSGIGSPEQALKNLNIPHEIAFACEIDKYARKTYQANFEPKMMLEDMTKEKWEGKEYYSDLFIGGIPCQAFSLAGKRLGELDPRGLLFYDFYRYVKNQQPKVFIIENVKGLLSDANGTTFSNWLQLLGRSVNTQEMMFLHPDSLEYNLHWTVLNSKDFGVPQNRERVFLAGIRKDLPNTFRFPIGWPLTIRLKDILEKEVDEKYYLSGQAIDWIVSHREKRDSQNKFPLTPDDISGCLTARYHKQGAEDMYISEPYCAAIRGRNPDNPSDRTTGTNLQQTLEPNSQGITNTLTSVAKDNLIVEPQKEVYSITCNCGCTYIGNLSMKCPSCKKIADGYINELTVKVKEATKKGYTEAYPGDSINISQPNSETRRGRVGKQIANTLETSCNQVIIEPQLILAGSLSGGKWDRLNESNRRVYDENGIAPTVTTMGGGNQEPKVVHQSRIRRLTPLECFRLQAFPDDFFCKAKEVNSDTQLYKQAGNSITVNVIQEIIKNLLPILK